jgi:hypothetical protein
MLLKNKRGNTRNWATALNNSIEMAVRRMEGSRRTPFPPAVEIDNYPLRTPLLTQKSYRWHHNADDDALMQSDDTAIN